MPGVIDLGEGYLFRLDVSSSWGDVLAGKWCVFAEVTNDSIHDYGSVGQTYARDERTYRSTWPASPQQIADLPNHRRGITAAPPPTPLPTAGPTSACSGPYPAVTRPGVAEVGRDTRDDPDAPERLSGYVIRERDRGHGTAASRKPKPRAHVTDPPHMPFWRRSTACRSITCRSAPLLT